MIFDDGLKDDPRDVDTLLSNELMRLSISDRNAIQEEIHGVRCLAPEETPELLQSSLCQLALELDRNLPSEITRALKVMPNCSNPAESRLPRAGEEAVQIDFVAETSMRSR